jgi:hypothetical protein
MTRETLIAVIYGAVILFGVMLSANAGAITFGDSGINTGQYMPPCAATSLVSLPISVDAPSRISVSSVVSAQSYNSGYNQYAEMVELHDQADTTILASIPSPFNQGLVDPNITYQLPNTGVLHDANNIPYVAAPGSYILKLIVQTYGSCAGSGPYAWSSTLSYILLSSALDRIFAGGFNAMILHPDTTELVA